MSKHSDMNILYCNELLLVSETVPFARSALTVYLLLFLCATLYCESCAGSCCTGSVLMHVGGLSVCCR